MIVGIDEVGRGCLAGPLVAGAVMLAEPIAGLRDSKKLTKLQRAKFDVIIRTQAVAYGLGWASVDEIDTLGLTAAVGLAMQRALDAITAAYEEIVIDGNHNFMAANPKSRCLIGADDLIPEVSAASIIAKVARDTFMQEISQQYPAYGFAQHVGYGTAAHRAALKLHGICDLHRRSFAPVRQVLETA